MESEHLKDERPIRATNLSDPLGHSAICSLLNHRLSILRAVVNADRNHIASRHSYSLSVRPLRS